MKFTRILAALAASVGLLAAAPATVAQAANNYQSTGCYAGSAYLSITSWNATSTSKTYHFSMSSPSVVRTGPDQYYRPFLLEIGSHDQKSYLGDGYWTVTGTGNRTIKGHWNLWTNGLEAFGPEIRTCTPRSI